MREVDEFRSLTFHSSDISDAEPINSLNATNFSGCFTSQFNIPIVLNNSIFK